MPDPRSPEERLAARILDDPTATTAQMETALKSLAAVRRSREKKAVQKARTVSEQLTEQPTPAVPDYADSKAAEILEWLTSELAEDDRRTAELRAQGYGKTEKTAQNTVQSAPGCAETGRQEPDATR